MINRIIPLLLICLISAGCLSTSQNVNELGGSNHNASSQIGGKANDIAIKLSPSPQPQAVQDLMRQVDKAITYEHLKKNAEKYSGSRWEFAGKILEIHEREGATWARISADPLGLKPMSVTFPFTTEFVEDDRVYVLGELAGEYTYETQAGWKLTIPAIMAYAILKPDEAAKIRAGKFEAQPKLGNTTAQTDTTGEAEMFERLQEQYKKMAADGGTSAYAIKKNILAVDADFSADKLIAKPQSYVGKPVLLTGIVGRVVPAKEGTTVALGLVSDSSKAVLVYVPYKVDYRDGQVVSAVGYMMGMYRYDNGTFPVLAARALLQPSQVSEFKESK